METCLQNKKCQNILFLLKMLILFDFKMLSCNKSVNDCNRHSVMLLIMELERLMNTRNYTLV